MVPVIRRGLAVVILVVFASVPALEVYCTLACSHATVAADADGCEHLHQAALTGGPIASADIACCHVTVSIAVPATTTSSSKVTLRPMILPQRVAAEPALKTGVRHLSIPFDSSSGPPGPLRVPLRI